MAKIEIDDRVIKKLIREEVKKAFGEKVNEPINSLTRARRACEEICRQICLKAGLSKQDGFSETCPLENMINCIKQHKLVPVFICEDICTIQRYGNKANHGLKIIDAKNAEPALNALSNLVNWYFKNYPEKESAEDDPEIEGEKLNDGTWKGKIQDMKVKVLNKCNKKTITHLAAGLVGGLVGVIIANRCRRKKDLDKVQPS